MWPRDRRRLVVRAMSVAMTAKPVLPRESFFCRRTDRTRCPAARRADNRSPAGLRMRCARLRGIASRGWSGSSGYRPHLTPARSYDLTTAATRLRLPALGLRSPTSVSAAHSPAVRHVSVRSSPTAVARTGSKSTNHDLNSARAIASSVSLIRRFNSILSSKAPRMAAMACCSSEAAVGRRDSEYRNAEVA